MPLEISVVVPQPAVARYWAIVVVKLPEFERIAIEPFFSGLLGMVTAERAADPHPVPGIGDAEPVRAKDVDAVGLPDGADLAGVVHRDLLGDDDDLLEIGVDAGELGDAVADAGGRQIDHAGVEPQPGVQAFAHRVEDGHLADRGPERLAGPAGRGPEDHVAAREGMAYGRHLARFAAQDVEDADPVLAGRDLGERVDADEVLEPVDALLMHCAAPPVPVPVPEPPPSHPRGRCSSRQRLAALLADDVVGVPVRPVRIAMAEPLLVLAVRGLRTSERGSRAQSAR